MIWKHLAQKTYNPLYTISTTAYYSYHVLDHEVAET